MVHRTLLRVHFGLQAAAHTVLGSFSVICNVYRPAMWTVYSCVCWCVCGGGVGVCLCVVSIWLSFFATYYAYVSKTQKLHDESKLRNVLSKFIEGFMLASN